jgi:hypothetical protein
MNGLAPPYLSELFIKRNEIHNLNTRNNKALYIPQYVQNSFRTENLLIQSGEIMERLG